MGDNNAILEMIDITKEFPGVKALDEVNFKVEKGEIHALVGENGAGKSTLMKILSGVYPSGSYTGKIIINGEEKHFNNIKESEKNGIAIIYQELAHVNQLDICENIFLGNEIANHGVINWDEAYKRTREILDEVNLNLKPTTIMENIGVGQQQMVEIAKAVSKKSDILILDEPTAALTETETENLFSTLRKLNNKGVTCIYISHKLSEIFEIADRVTVLRDGRTVGTEDINKLDEDKIISMMVGRKLTQRFPDRSYQPEDYIFEVNDWIVVDPEKSDKILLDNINFKLKKGEILGIFGLMGSGRTEFALSLLGKYGRKKSGVLKLNGENLKVNNPKEVIKKGIGYLTEDRNAKGLVGIMSVKNNITMASMERLANKGVINENEEILKSRHFVDRLNIKTPSIEQQSQNLSGGNQQKVVLSKWLMTEPEVLILDEPTRGIDVGAKYEIHSIMNELTESGVSIIMISSELPEVLGMSDRIIVMAEGKITGQLSKEEATQEKIMSFATGRYK